MQILVALNIIVHKILLIISLKALPTHHLYVANAVNHTQVITLS